jgi:hypothetical protein
MQDRSNLNDLFQGGSALLGIIMRIGVIIDVTMRPNGNVEVEDGAV